MILDINSLTSESVKQLYQAIFTYCEQSATGTLFLVTAENRSGQVVFHQGQLLGLSYGGEHSEKALEGLYQQTSLRQSFTNNLIFPLPETLLPEDSVALLEVMGISQSLAKAEDTDSPEPVVDAVTEKVSKPKSRRIYRGQVVQ